MLTMERWQELLGECPAVTMCRDAEEHARVCALVPRRAVMAEAVGRALAEMGRRG